MSAAFSRIVSIDYGTKRVGLAMTDPLRMFAQPIGTFAPDEALEQILLLNESAGIETLVIGWPFTEEGIEGKATRRVEPYVGRLKNRLPGVAIVRQDERHSSQRAAEALVAAGAPKKIRREKGRLDSMAAVLILQDYLDELNESDRRIS